MDQPGNLKTEQRGPVCPPARGKRVPRAVWAVLLLLSSLTLPPVSAVSAPEPAGPAPDSLPPVSAVSAPAPPEPAGDSSAPETPRESCSLHRFPDPVALAAENLPGAFLGVSIRALRLFRAEGGRLSPIRFQVDERTPEGDWILPWGKKNNAARSNGLLDPQDVILFMAKDAGDRAGEAFLPPGASPASWIELFDPVDGGTGWVVVAAFSGEAPPLCALPDYVEYDPEREIVSSRYTRAEYLVTPDGRHTSFYKHHGTPPEAGGTGENLVDRLKFRVQIRFLFNLLPLSLHEEMLGSDVIAYIRGPVHVLRRLEQYVRLPFGIRGVKTYADVDLYESFATTPITLRVPRGFGRVVSSASLQFGTDYSPNVIGSFFRNSETSEALIVDGRMSEAEKRFDSRQDRWRIFYGPFGVLMTRTVYPPELIQRVRISQRYLDDITVTMPVERYPGCVGYAYTEVHASQVPAGAYRIFLDFYFPPHYRPGDETRFLQLRDHPLRIRAGGREAVNPQNLHGEVGKDF